jgi:hypothetical protein
VIEKEIHYQVRTNLAFAFKYHDKGDFLLRCQKKAIDSSQFNESGTSTLHKFKSPMALSPWPTYYSSEFAPQSLDLASNGKRGHDGLCFMMKMAL